MSTAEIWLLVLSGLMAAVAVRFAVAEERELRRRRELTCCEHCTNTLTRRRAAAIPAQRTHNTGGH